VAILAATRDTAVRVTVPGAIRAVMALILAGRGRIVPEAAEAARSARGAVVRVSGPVITMYSTVWCGYCRRLKAQMDREGIDYRVVDIEHDLDAARLVMAVNGGMQTVPTLVFPDGVALTNPTLAQVKAQLAAA
jgi:mycoredoxin